MNKNTNLEQDYLQLLEDIVKYGVSKDDRTGTGTKSLFGRQLRHNMSNGFPLLTTKKMAWRAVVTELLWFLRGDTSIKYLKENNCNIWDGDCWKAYQKTMSTLNDEFISSSVLKKYSVENKEEFFERLAKDDDFDNIFGDFGPIYGEQYRNWTTEDGDTGIDQIQWLIDQIKTNPDSRRLLVNVWNVGDLHKMVLPPCHYSFQVYTRELSLHERVKLYGLEKINTTDNGYYEQEYARFKVDEHNIPTRAISLMFNMRSSDAPLGLPFNLASYGLLLEIFGRMVNMVPDELVANLGDVHVYNNQVDGVYEQISRIPFTFPKLVMDTTLNFNGSLDDFLATATPKSFNIEGYESHPTVKYPLSN